MVTSHDVIAGCGSNLPFVRLRLSSRLSRITQGRVLTLFAFRFATTLARLTLDSRPYAQARHGFIRLRVTLSVLAFGATANYRELFWVRDAYCVCSYLSNIYPSQGQQCVAIAQGRVTVISQYRVTGGQPSPICWNVARP